MDAMTEDKLAMIAEICGFLYRIGWCSEAFEVNCRARIGLRNVQGLKAWIGEHTKWKEWLGVPRE